MRVVGDVAKREKCWFAAPAVQPWRLPAREHPKAVHPTKRLQGPSRTFFGGGAQTVTLREPGRMEIVLRQLRR
jgi:hypothetical protein